LDAAATAVSTVTQKLRIPLPMVVAAFEAIHDSNMSKLDDEGKPIRREDGKILKGPNYKAPDLTGIVSEWKKFQTEMAEQEAANAQTAH